MRRRTGTAFLLTAAFAIAFLPCSAVLAQTAGITVHADRPGHAISPMLYGLMTEEINHSYDGGLYAELIQNRAFKDSRTAPVHWSPVDQDAEGTIALASDSPLSAALPISLRVSADVKAGGFFGAANDGWWGVPVTPHTVYHGSFYACAEPGFTGPLTVRLETADGATVAAVATTPPIGSTWRQYRFTLRTGGIRPSTANRFVLGARSSGAFRITQVSLFPPTFHRRSGGNRIDLMRKMADMKPTFLRLPGGNYLEGNSIADRFEWTETIGRVDSRPGHQGPWGYRSTDGMGLLEFLRWCEELKMEPLLAVFDGYALNGEYAHPGPELAPWVQSALDEIEYVTGSVRTPFGARRAADGHPAPFKLRYVEIGNEDYAHEYDARYAQFYDAIKAKYPGLTLIATSPVKSRPMEVLDDHYYRSARAMAADSHHYDAYSRTGAKIFVGEWASIEGSPTPTLQAALGDAAWMTGMERNSDLVTLSCYAPLLVNVNSGASQWGTNLIGYDALHSFGSPSYYAQQMFARNRGDVTLPLEIVQPVPEGRAAEPRRGTVGVGTWNTQAEFRDVKVTASDGDIVAPPDASEWQPGAGSWSAVDGALRQTSAEVNCRDIFGHAPIQDMTYTLKARKLGGSEGFLILFHVRDKDNYVWWNIGGWGNTRTALERAAEGSKEEIGPSSPSTIETGRWYDIRVETRGAKVRCYLDGKLVLEATVAPAVTVPIYATASRDLSSGDVIVKVVNFSGERQPLRIDILGERLGGTAEITTLSGQPSDVNSIADPRKVSPGTERAALPDGPLTRTFPAYSVTVLRVRGAR